MRQILAPEGLLGRYEHNGEGWDWVQVMPQAKFEQMDFGDAVRALKEGKRVARASWPKMVLQFTDGQVLRDRDGNSGKKDYWLPSQNDVLAEDWEIVE
ncbi:MAG TPA: MW1434 family type I TA system toxin [Polyangiaceae bacterium]|nr:MW1434 family type I TA system toxin [Polyangiaceae bacterium]